MLVFWFRFSSHIFIDQEVQKLIWPQLHIRVKTFTSNWYPSSNRWEDQDAQVVCRQLGMTGGRAVIAAWFGEGTSPIMLDTVECNGDETSIVRCAHTDWGVHDCTHSEDAGVICSKNIPRSQGSWAYMGPTWGRQDPGGPHVGPMNLAIRVESCRAPCGHMYDITTKQNFPNTYFLLFLLSHVPYALWCLLFNVVK